jgi:hypothetical protein
VLLLHTAQEIELTFVDLVQRQNVSAPDGEWTWWLASPKGRQERNTLAMTLAEQLHVSETLYLLFGSGRPWPASWLPTEEEILQLEEVVSGARQLWIDCGFKNIKGNPKCHLIFDGHLVHQFRKYGGLADKNEDA